ncbi:MAG: ATPase-like [Nitrososphaeraceae archaeon]|nr:ATPase-like [Nitrososphaeraceae archaeon]
MNIKFFTDINSIQLGDVWSNVIEKNISTCDIFIVIVTSSALKSTEVEKEVLQAQKEYKIIIPCFHRSVINSSIKWRLNNIQGVEFDDKYELARNLSSKIIHENYTTSKKITNEYKMNLSTKQVRLSNPKPNTFYGEKRIFVGREKYIDKIKEYFNNSNDPIAVTGLGGIGKSSLVFKAIHKCEAIFDLIIPIYFSTIGVDFDLFLFSIAKNLNLVHEFENLTVEEKEQILIDGLTESKKHPLLFLDNYETVSGILKRHNIDQYSERQYENVLQINNFLNRLPSNISIILTSRLRKNLDGERELVLDGLDIEEGVRLFTILAGTDLEEDPENIKAIQEIVNKTDGHPLSIEVLAKSYQGLGVDEFTEMISHLGLGIVNPTIEKRLITLEATFDYSLNSLDENIKVLLPKLTIFNSPFPISAALDIFNAKKEDVTHLYNRSLLTRIASDECGRIPRQEFWLYDFHPVIRNYLQKIVMNKYFKLEEEYGEKFSILM